MTKFCPPLAVNLFFMASDVVGVADRTGSKSGVDIKCQQRPPPPVGLCIRPILGACTRSIVDLVRPNRTTAFSLLR